ncbi:MAG: hypothetical protein GX219_07955 [Tissierellia bacterium]|nr:hypothetical protein [Tissierellia bacterium]
MEDIYNQIFEIDNKTQTIVKDTNEEINRLKDKLNKKIHEIENESALMMRSESNEASTKILDEAHRIIENMNSEFSLENKKNEELYHNKKENIIAEAMKLIFGVDI